ncbi:hypothetical protein ERW49_04480 [Aliivibrio finisterrensis]|uniref:DUF5666 domain-containing protein n=1 Tax=Aliivibrio finisterrensis TaxID=511998 RepID=A0A4V1Z841_9GAMM|nr:MULTISPECIES: DUF5666 domain-containing protein [Aliivibrio]MDD9175296.1 DUF5666 domain-containing protein [Aliivibrio sp. S3TY1]MDD9192375.1 DUF5666 domain-containing protein [Aliivibrio sp. S2TY2]RYU47613.1 hypothetical protein ERW49_04480 [Aliivibrio finisterrensis]
MKKVAVLLLGTVMLSGCGSDDSGDTVSSHAQANVIEGTIESINPLANEVTMNGVDYHVTSVSFGDNDDISFNALKDNMMVRLSTNNESGLLTVSNAKLTLEPTMVGVITNINKDTGDFKINGMVLSAEKSMLAEIDNNDWVMISSLPTANAGYHVLSIVKFESDPLNGEVEMEGIVNHINDNQFTLGSNFTITYSQAVIENNIKLSNGQWVEVTGEMTDGTTLIASEIEVEEYDNLDQYTDIEGVITSVTKDKSSFVLNYKGRFIVTSNTIYEDGKKENLVVGTYLEVTAKEVNGKNQVLEIEFETQDSDGNDWPDSNDIEFIGKIVSDNVDINTTKSFIMNTLQGDKTIYMTANTEFDDNLTILNLDTGMDIEVDAYLINGQYIASEIERKDND